ncbi:hypothetical protein Cni_G23265 [Canna indica]|uniref:Reverse transcriptase n=1 Tax=Canna indica TaxID=4628 RepID=A0AAQ3KTN8_9LILI|nr:hypothetical protein Cni_G23265 [Canna indica]
MKYLGTFISPKRLEKKYQMKLVQKVKDKVNSWAGSKISQADETKHLLIECEVAMRYWKLPEKKLSNDRTDRVQEDINIVLVDRCGINKSNSLGDLPVSQVRKEAFKTGLSADPNLLGQ